MNNLPTTRFDDIVVHPRDNDLVLATHGRGIWIMDDVTPLQQLSADVVAAEAHLFTPRGAVRWRADPTRSRSVTGSKNFRGDNAPPGTAISYHLKAAASGDVKITIANAATGEVFRNLDGTKEQGINTVQWNLRGNPPPRPAGQVAGGGGGGGGFGGQQQGPLAQPGLYRVTLMVGGRDYTRLVEVEEDRWLTER
jgi:hypothetical protein